MDPALRLRGGLVEQVHQHGLAAPDRAPDVEPLRRRRGIVPAAEQPAEGAALAGALAAAEILHQAGRGRAPAGSAPGRARWRAVRPGPRSGRRPGRGTRRRPWPGSTARGPRRRRRSRCGRPVRGGTGIGRPARSAGLTRPPRRIKPRTPVPAPDARQPVALLHCTTVAAMPDLIRLEGGYARTRRALRAPKPETGTRCPIRIRPFNRSSAACGPTMARRWNPTSCGSTRRPGPTASWARSAMRPPSPMPRNALNAEGLMFGGFVDGTLRGLGELRPASAPPPGFVLGTEAEAAFAVEKAYRRNGLGQALFRRIAAAARNRGVRRPARALPGLEPADAGPRHQGRRGPAASAAARRTAPCISPARPPSPCGRRASPRRWISPLPSRRRESGFAGPGPGAIVARYDAARTGSSPPAPAEGARHDGRFTAEPVRPLRLRGPLPVRAGQFRPRFRPRPVPTPER